MNLDARIVQFLGTEGAGYDDDCLAHKLKVEPRQAINQACRKLQAGGLLKREQGYCPTCGRNKILNQLYQERVEPQPTEPARPRTTTTSPMSQDSSERLATLQLHLKEKQQASPLNRQIHHESTMLALEHLKRIHTNVVNWRTSSGTETGADIEGLSGDGQAVVAEVKGTDPYHGDRLGAAQRNSIEWDIRKLEAHPAPHKYLFLIGQRAVDAVTHQFRNRLSRITVLDILSLDSNG